eukprot:10278022-Alexandrium_andersonii.AAC.1
MQGSPACCELTRTSMLVKSVQLGLGRCAGSATMAESPRGRGRTPSTEAHWGYPQRGPQTGAALQARAL